MILRAFAPYLTAVLLLSLVGTGHGLLFLEQPEPIIFLHAGDNHTLVCLTNFPLIGNISDDPVTIRWLRNGELLTPNAGDGFEDLGNGTLEIINIQPYDGWKQEPLQFRCAATNSHGTLISLIAHVGLVYLDPYPETARPRKVFAVPGNTAVLSCPGSGQFNYPSRPFAPGSGRFNYPSRPFAQVQWLKNGEPINDSRALNMPSGDLQLLNYGEADAGEYQCFMINPMFVEREAQIRELVRQEREWLAMRREWLLNEQRRIPDHILTPHQRRTFEHYFWLVDERYRILAFEEEQRRLHDEELRIFRTSPPVTLATETFMPITLTFDKSPPSRSENPITIFLGWPVVLEVSASAIDVPTFTWIGPGEELPPGRASIIGSGNLQINPTYANDTGFYRVTARSGNEAITQITHLVVQVPPTAATFPDNQTVFEGESMRIECPTNGTQYFRKSWFHNGEDMMLELNDTLEFHWVNLTHNGIYQCFVENEAGTAMAAAYVTILSLPTFIRHPTPHVVILDTQNFEISCAVAGEPFPWVTWLFNGEELQIINGTVNDTLSTANKTVWWNVTEIDGHPVIMTTLHSNASTYGETGAYTCRANNSHGVVESQAAIVDVYGRPTFEWILLDQFAPLDDHYTFQFETAGLPLPMVEWEYPEGADLGGRVQILVGGHLRILFVQRSDLGVYRLTITNKFGSESAEIRLGERETPQVYRIHTALMPRLGQDFWLACDMTGAPLPNVTWFKNGVPILGVWDPFAFNVPIWLKYSSMMTLVEQETGPSNLIRGNLTIRFLTRDDFAMYTCRGETEAGMGERNFRLGPDGPIVLDERLNEDVFPVWLIVVTIILSALVGFSIVLAVLYGIYRFITGYTGQKSMDSHPEVLPKSSGSKPSRPTPAPKTKQKPRIGQPTLMSTTSSSATTSVRSQRDETVDRPVSCTFRTPSSASKGPVYSEPSKDADSTTV